MSWLELHVELRDHPKVIDLAERLGIPDPYAAGLCAYLWTWALERAPDGVIRNSPRILSSACGWDGDQDLLHSSLILSGWIDLMDPDSLYIHDWDEYAGRFTSKKQKNAERMREARAKEQSVQERAMHVQRTKLARASSVQRTCDAQDEHVQGTCDERATNVQGTCDECATNVQGTCDERAGATVPNSTEHNQERKAAASSERVSKSYSAPAHAYAREIDDNDTAANIAAAALLSRFRVLWPKAELLPAERRLLRGWVQTYGAELVAEKIELLSQRRNVRRPFGALTAAIAQDWKPDLEREEEGHGIDRERTSEDAEWDATERAFYAVPPLRGDHAQPDDGEPAGPDPAARATGLPLPHLADAEGGGAAGGRGG